MHPFHLAFPVRDIASTRAFYCGTLGRPEARSAERWIDIDFWGHQLSAHVVDAADSTRPPQRRRRKGRADAALRDGAPLGRVARAR